VELGNALADLAVTGRVAYTRFQSLQPIEASVVQQITSGIGVLLNETMFTVGELFNLLTTLPGANPAMINSAVSAALDRAYAVAWALRGPAAQRDAARVPLGWIAVSGEDDKPHRPVNVPPPSLKLEDGSTVAVEQYEIPVTVRGITVQTRFFIASAVEDNIATGNPHSLRELPTNPQPHIPRGHRVILFLHGHSSGAEEALHIIPHIHRAGLEHGTKLSIISFDLPNNGYSESFDHNRVALSSETTFPGDLFDHHTPIRVPVLDFIEDFVVAFVDTLDSPLLPIKNRYAGVIGGSLGGNLGLRLGRRQDLVASPWLNAGIVSWDAASVWEAMVQDIDNSRGSFHCLYRWNETETNAHRGQYFTEVFDSDAFAIIFTIIPAQPKMWYRDGWESCKTNLIRAVRIERREIYDANFRQWHWRVAGEQLVYSHVDRVDHMDGNSPFRYQLNTVRQLLVAGEMDNYPYSRIYNATRALANLMVNTPGRSLFLHNTGHSIHAERPRFLAKQIVDFLIVESNPLAQGSDMLTGEVLNSDQSITSANGRFHFIYQDDGNLVLYDGGTPLWASGTDGRPVGVCIMQGDGNLVIYARNGQPIWSSDTWQHPGSRLVVQNDGNVVIYSPDGTPVWSTNTLPPLDSTAQGDDMQSGEILNPGLSIASANGRYHFIYQGDGNLVLYDGGTPLWASGTDGRPVGVCIMQADGNLVMYARNGQPIWSSDTWQHPGSRLVVQNDGNVVIYSPDGTPVWSTNTWIPHGSAAQGDAMQPGEVLNPGLSIASANGRFHFIYQGDGNLVLYDGVTPLWASSTDGRPVGVCIMQDDGNLVIYARGGQPIWSSDTWQYPGSRLVVQDDGNVVIYSPDGTPVWATDTWRHPLDPDQNDDM
jgi:pimeloyl-ACP methyl ester carboxylesterase